MDFPSFSSVSYFAYVDARRCPSGMVRGGRGFASRSRCTALSRVPGRGFLAADPPPARNPRARYRHSTHAQTNERTNKQTIPLARSSARTAAAISRHPTRNPRRSQPGNPGEGTERDYAIVVRGKSARLPPHHGRNPRTRRASEEEDAPPPPSLPSSCWGLPGRSLTGRAA